MTDKTLNGLAYSIFLIALGFDHSYEQKELFHKNAKAYLNELAKRMNLPKDSYSVRSNKGGPAVLGDVILHTDSLYINLGGSLYNNSFMYRKCQSQKDYTGGINTWMRYTDLVEKSTDEIIRHLQHPL